MQPVSAVNSFIDQGNFEALSGRRALRCGKHQFRAKITAYSNCFRVIIVEQSGINKERKMTLSLPHTFVFSCLP